MATTREHPAANEGMGLTARGCMTERIRMSQSGASPQIWQARVPAELARMLLDDARVLGLTGRSDVVRAGLHLLHREALEERMARDIDNFYGDETPPLPVGVLPDDGSDG
jgi:hypothetical protein